MSTLKNSESLAEILKESPPALDDLARARMEKKILERKAPARSKRGYWIAGGSALAIAAAALVWIALPKDEASPGPIAHFEQRDVRASVASGTLDEGSTIQTSATQVADIRVAESRVHIGEGSRVRLETLTSTRLDLSLERGSVRVGFHPRERGREHMTVRTENARVEVVGTEFTVRVDGDATFVRVTEGVVRVVPRDGQARLVRAGEETQVGGHEERAEVVPVEAEPPQVVAPEIGQERSPHERFEEARRLAESGRTDDAMRILRTLTRPPAPASVRVDAWTLMADLHRRAAAYAEAARAYDEAARAGRGTLDGQNALMELARVEERNLNDAAAARATYERYLRESPSGANATTVRRELCRLGAREHCDP